MAGRIFVAGATGAIGRRLCPLLVADGWDVTGATRSPGKTAWMREIGVTPVVVNVFDERAIKGAVIGCAPDVVVHQLTDLPANLDPTLMEEARRANARIRDIGTRNLVAAALAAGAQRLVAQSIAFAYAPGTPPFAEEQPLNTEAPGSDGATARAVASLENQVLEAPLTGLVLRYGRLYGPGTSAETPPAGVALHVDAAADAARRAVRQGAGGAYNVAEDGGSVVCDKAKGQLGWSADFRIPG